MCDAQVDLAGLDVRQALVRLLLGHLDQDLVLPEPGVLGLAGLRRAATPAAAASSPALSSRGAASGGASPAVVGEAVRVELGLDALARLWGLLVEDHDGVARHVGEVGQLVLDWLLIIGHEIARAFVEHGGLGKILGPMCLGKAHPVG